MITVRNLTKKVNRETELLSKVSFQADAGEFIVIVGASGSGKTTLLRCLSLQEKWDQGQFIYNGREITHPNPIEKYRLRKHWAFLTEVPDVNMNQDALKNVLAGRFHHMSLLRKITRTVSQQEHMFAMDYLDKVGLLDKAHDKLVKLSGGEKQRVAIAKAMVKEAKVIFADEPVKGLPSEAQNRVMEDLRDVCKRDGVIVFCAVSSLDLAERYASRIWGLNHGRVVLDISGRRLTQLEKNKVFE